MGNKIVTLSEDGTTLSTEDNDYDYPAGLQELIWLKHPRFYSPQGYGRICRTDIRYFSCKIHES